MALYVDTSALLKRYIDEPESELCDRQLLEDPLWVTARHTLIETRRNLARLLEAHALETARSNLELDWQRMNIVELDAQTCEVAAQIAEAIGVRTLDALHLAAATRAGKGALTLLTFDLRQARAARSLGFSVVGA